MTVILTKKQITSFQKEILEWYSKNKRDLPWRRVPYDTRLQQRDPYKILVSEVMLQQTQVSRVIPKYEVWLKAFPSLESLAQALTRDVLLHWSGLGYNRRALYLQKLAKQLVQQSANRLRTTVVDGRRWSASEVYFPRTEKELRQLHGIGEYTARALLCFAFDQQVAVVDTNVRRVILTRIKKAKSKMQNYTNKEIQDIAEQLLPKGKAYEWNQALMDYAASELKGDPSTPSVILRTSRVKQKIKFKDSDRFFRGLILRILLQHHQMTLAKLFTEIQKTKHIEKERLEKIVLQLEKDGLLMHKSKIFMLPED